MRATRRFASCFGSGTRSAPEDPYDPRLPADEYDWMISPLLDRLEADAEPDEIAAFLVESARNRYGLEPDTTKTSKIAERVTALH